MNNENLNNKNKSNSSYESKDIIILKGLEAVRKRPGMYIGDIETKGLHHLIWEILDNSIDEVSAKFANQIKITFKENNFVLIEDNGRGIPYKKHPETGKSTLETVFTELHAGGKFNNSVYKTSGGLHGVGASVVNALSSYLKVSTYRDSFKTTIEFTKGGIKKQDITTEEISEKAKTYSGTSVLFKPDKEIFGDLKFNFDLIELKCKQLAYLNSKLKITLVNELTNKKIVFSFKEGIKSFVKDLNNKYTTLNEGVIFFSNSENDIEFDIALQYIKNDLSRTLSFCNNINTQEGGTHEDGFKLALLKSVNKYLTNNNDSLPKEFKTISFQKEDVLEGLTLVISAKHPDPMYKGQTKTKLSNPDIKSIIYKFTNLFFETFFLENPNIIRNLLLKFLLSYNSRLAAKKAKELEKKKSSIEGIVLPGKLADCSSNKPSETELFIVEGVSAGGTAKLARNKNFQAILSLSGKILNVEKSTINKALDNKEIKSIISSLGYNLSLDNVNIDTLENFNSDFDSEEVEKKFKKLRYHKIIIMTDADVDGQHIRILLLTLLYKFMKELILKGFVYIANPPLYKIKYKKKLIYLYDEEEHIEWLSKLSDFQKSKISSKQRYKGLGEMNAKQLWELAMNPENRTLSKVTIEDIQECQKYIPILMGKDIDNRKLFIKENAKKANLDI